MKSPAGSVYRINPDSWVWNQYDPQVMDLDIDGFLATAREAGPGQGRRTDN